MGIWVSISLPSAATKAERFDRSWIILRIFARPICLCRRALNLNGHFRGRRLCPQKPVSRKQRPSVAGDSFVAGVAANSLRCAPYFDWLVRHSDVPARPKWLGLVFRSWGTTVNKPLYFQLDSPRILVGGGTFKHRRASAHSGVGPKRPWPTEAVGADKPRGSAGSASASPQ
jgi:hypothetical protein